MTAEEQPRSYAPLYEPSGDRARAYDRVPYEYSWELKLAINVALATGRPLLLRGDPGTGKTTLARDVAFQIGLPYFEEVVTSRTTARDLIWGFDNVKRLAEASGGGDVSKVASYVTPGVIWKAFDPDGAGKNAGERFSVPAGESAYMRRPVPFGAVLLLDEIDKADPDVPNDLLVPVELRTFEVAETGEKVRAAKPPLLFFTTNEERDLPRAFLRRCVVVKLEAPAKTTLKAIARLHGEHWKKPLASDDALLDEVIARFEALRARAEKEAVRKPGIAEFLDALKACVELGVTDSKNELWQQVTSAALWKHPEKSQEKPSQAARSSPGVE